jgi:hypothetical protein
VSSGWYDGTRVGARLIDRVDYVEMTLSFPLGGHHDHRSQGYRDVRPPAEGDVQAPITTGSSSGKSQVSTPFHVTATS